MNDVAVDEVLVTISPSNGTFSAVNKLRAATDRLLDASLWIEEIHKGTWGDGQVPLRFDCGNSPELNELMGKLAGVFVKLSRVSGMDVKELAAMIFNENYPVVHEVSKLVQREKHREEIVSELEQLGVNPDEVSSDKMERLVDKFEENLENGDIYAEAYWRAAQGPVDDFVRATKQNTTGVSKELCDAAVEAAVLSIRGVGVDMGSGYFDLREFVVGGEIFDLHFEVCKLKDENTHEEYFAVYYAVEYQDGDNLFSEWDYTQDLDVTELKRIVGEIANTDFSEDIRKVMNEDRVPEGSLERKIREAEGGRNTFSKWNENSEREER